MACYVFFKLEILSIIKLILFKIQQQKKRLFTFGAPIFLFLIIIIFLCYFIIQRKISCKFLLPLFEWFQIINFYFFIFQASNRRTINQINFYSQQEPPSYSSIKLNKEYNDLVPEYSSVIL